MAAKSPEQFNILIYDQDALWAQAVAEVLAGRGYSVDVVTDDFATCLKKCASKVYALLLVNIDSLPSKGAELMGFVESFPQTEPVMVGDDHNPDCQELWNRKGLEAPRHLGSKDEQMVVRLADKVDGVMREKGLIRDALTIVWPDDMDRILENLVRNNSDLRAKYSDPAIGAAMLLGEANMIISQMFAPKSGGEQIAEKVKVEEFSRGGGRSGSEVLLLTPVVLLDTGHAKPALLKFGPKDEVNQESMNYDKFVEWFLKRHHTVRKIAHAQAGNFAGLLYSFPRDDASASRSFADYLRTEPEERSLGIINEMFSPDNKQWLSVDGNNFVSEDQARFQTYYFDEVLRATPHKLAEWLSVLARQVDGVERKTGKDVWTMKKSSINFAALSKTIPNPVHFLMSPPCVERLNMTVVHGDLHSENILIDGRAGEETYYFIDFKYTGFGHIYRDFLELELAVRYDLLSSASLSDEERMTSLAKDQVDAAGLKKLCRLEEALMKKGLHGTDPRDPLLVEGQADFDPRLAKVFNLVTRIRELAQANAPGDMKHYYLGLIPCALRALKYDYPLAVRLHRLLIAGIYAQSMDWWKGPVPSKGKPAGKAKKAGAGEPA